MDQLFKKLWIEMQRECEGATVMFTNDIHGYKRWYSEQVYQLCIKYKTISEKEEEQ